MTVKNQFIATNPVVTRDANTGKVRVCLEVLGLEGYPPGTEIALMPSLSEYLLDSDSTAELVKQLLEVQKAQA